MRYRVPNVTRSNDEKPSSMVDMRPTEDQYRESSYRSSLIMTMKGAGTCTESRTYCKGRARIGYSHRPKFPCDRLTSDIHAWVESEPRPRMHIILHLAVSLCEHTILSTPVMIMLSNLKDKIITFQSVYPIRLVEPSHVVLAPTAPPMSARATS